MSKSHIAIVLLVGALVASNAWWAWNALDAGVTATYQDASLRDNHRALAQAFAILPLVAKPDATREQVLNAAMNAVSDRDSFEKDGFVWVGSLGLKFSDSGKLIDVAPTWSPF